MEVNGRALPDEDAVAEQMAGGVEHLHLQADAHLDAIAQEGPVAGNAYAHIATDDRTALIQLHAFLRERIALLIRG